MDLLQQPVCTITRFVRRRDPPDVGVKHTVGVLLDTHNTAPLASLDDYLYLTILLPLRLQDAPECSDLVYLIGGWLVDSSVMLGRKKYLALAGHGPLEGHHGTWTAYLKCDLCIRKDNDIANRDHGEPLDVGGHFI